VGSGVAEELNIRAIVPDRPGLGCSEPQQARSIADWAVDMAALADHLGLERVAILGYSGGGPLRGRLRPPDNRTGSPAWAS